MINLNLLPKNLRRRVEPGYWRLAAGAVVLLTVLTMGGIHFSTLAKIHSLESQRNELQLEVDALKPALDELARLNARKDEIGKVLAVKTQLETKAVPWSDNIAGLVSHFPRAGNRTEISIKSLSAKSLLPADIQANQASGNYDGKPLNIEFTIQGEAPTQGAITRLISAFENPDNDDDPLNDKFGINFQNQSFDPTKGIYSFGANLGMLGVTPNVPTPVTSTNATPQAVPAGGQ